MCVKGGHWTGVGQNGCLSEAFGTGRLTTLPAHRCSPRFSQSEQSSRELVITLINNKMKCWVPSACWEGREIHGFLSASGKKWSPQRVDVKGIVRPNHCSCELNPPFRALITRFSVLAAYCKHKRSEERWETGLRTGGSKVRWCFRTIEMQELYILPVPPAFTNLAF